MNAQRRGAYGMVIPDGVCGAYVADEGGEWWCRRALGHRGGCTPYTTTADGPQLTAARHIAEGRIAGHSALDGHAHARAVANQARLARGQWVRAGAMGVRLS